MRAESRAVIAESYNYWGWKFEVVACEPDTMGAIRCGLLADRKTHEPHDDCATRFKVSHRDRRFFLERDGTSIYADQTLEGIRDRLEYIVHSEVPLVSSSHVFVHSGAVHFGKCLILLPGPGFVGKSTLTRAMLELGGEYFSDEYAVFDAAGRVHPYRRRLTFRPHGQPEIRQDYSESAAAEPSHPGIVALCIYVEGAHWNPSTLSRGEAILALFQNSVTAKLSPPRDLDILTRATLGARFLYCERGEAAEAAQALRELADE